MSMNLSDFDFELPADRIALRPAVPRDSARMLMVQSGSRAPLVDARVPAILDNVRPGDVMVVNNTRVIPAALSGTRKRGDAIARISVNLLERRTGDVWSAFAKPLKRLKVGEEIVFSNADADTSDTLRCEVSAKNDDATVELVFDRSGPELDAALIAVGSMPLPPYIAGKRPADRKDVDDYQTMFAERSGAVAAPTAGLHFTDKLVRALAEKGVGTAEVTLHVGAGTFLPVKSDHIDDHVMHSEYGEISEAVADRLNRAKAAGGRIMAVGTTSLRLLESAAREDGTLAPFLGNTDIFIKPGYRFRAVDMLMTNFHLPRSTLFMLVCAFAGTELMKAAYAHAIDRGYRFYSYGDASLLYLDRSAK